MLQIFLNWWQRFVALHVCCDNPNDIEKQIAEEHRKADAINHDIKFLWKEIDHAVYHHHFAIIAIEIDNFKETYAGVDDFDMIVENLEQHLSDRQDAVQALWLIE